MPLHVRSIAISFAVVFYFGLSLVGWAAGLSPFTCCKRALAGAALAYVVAVLAVKAVNAILTDAMIKRQMKRHKEQAGDSEY